MDYLSTSDQISQVLGTSGTDWKILRFFFDFRSGTNIANTFEGLLRSLLLQMVEKVPGLETGLAQFSAKSHVPEHTLQWDLRSLKDAFYRALAESPTGLCLFIDGLDEYEGQMYELVRFFFSISERCGPRAGQKVCLASRPEGALALGLEACPGFRMQDHNTQGIARYVWNMLDSRILPDEQDRDAFSKKVAWKAEGVFLWARFAVSEVISSFSRGETLDELNRRLDEVPLEMDEMYSKIFGRMSPGDRHDAQLMFQLVCFAKVPSPFSNGLTLLQLKEAVSVANNRTVDPAHERRSSELHRFRRTLRAKSGGLLEEISIKASGISPGSEESIESDRNDPGKLSIRLIHRTVKSYLDQNGWLLELQINNDSFSPHALWLNICCKNVQSILGPSTSRSQYTNSRAAQLDDLPKPSVRHSLIQYASYSLFYHARFFEALNEESSYKYLSLVSPSLLVYLRDRSRFMVFHDKAMNAIYQKPNTQPWQIVVEQGLALCSGDVIKGGLYAPRGDDEAITAALALHKYTADQPLDTSKDSLSQLVTLLLDSGAIVSRTSIIMCLRNGTVRTLQVLLDYWYKGSIEADAAGRFSLLFELAVNREKEGFESMLDLLLAREKDMLQVHAPDGNILHDMIAAMAERRRLRYNLERVESLVKRGVDIKAYSTRGTPLQLAWRCFHSPETLPHNRVVLSKLGSVLVENGADTDWTEPNGTVVSKDDIVAWCRWPHEQLRFQSEFEFVSSPSAEFLRTSTTFPSTQHGHR